MPIRVRYGRVSAVLPWVSDLQVALVRLWSLMCVAVVFAIVVQVTYNVGLLPVVRTEPYPFFVGILSTPAFWELLAVAILGYGVHESAHAIALHRVYDGTVCVRLLAFAGDEHHSLVKHPRGAESRMTALQVAAIAMAPAFAFAVVVLVTAALPGVYSPIRTITGAWRGAGAPVGGLYVLAFAAALLPSPTDVRTAIRAARHLETYQAAAIAARCRHGSVEGASALNASERR